MRIDFESYKHLSMLSISMAFIIMTLSCYWQSAPWLAAYGLTARWLDIFLISLSQYFNRPYVIRAAVYFLLCVTAAMRTGGKMEKSWTQIITTTAIGAAIFFIIPANWILYITTATLGFVISSVGLIQAFRKMGVDAVPDEDEGFRQNTRLIRTSDSVNIPYEFVWQGKKYKGWINCINPYRASIVLGSPGSGKSFAVYFAFIEQQLRKGFTMFLYDYKFPDLTERVLTEIAYQAKNEKLWRRMKVKPSLYIINFDDPTRSNRCNPIHHSYLHDPADASEIAELVFDNINKGKSEKSFDFFGESAKVYLDAIVWWLANFDEDAIYNTKEGVEEVLRTRGKAFVDSLPREALEVLDGTRIIDSRTDYVNKGRYCTFPHVIEVMAYNYKKVFQVLQFTRGLEAKISPFSEALQSGVMEQLQGQTASAQIPLAKFSSPALYWAMSGDDFTLDINNPRSPKIVCMGNNPDRQSIYGVTLALYTSRMFKLINHKGKLKSAVLIDELPTIIMKGIAQLIATARQNKVAITLGAQDKSQLRRDYGDKDAEVIFSTVGNTFSGSVEGRTAKDISETFGKQFKRMVNVTDGDDNFSTSISYQQHDILPASKIVDMSQGTFCGWVKDNFDDKISFKKFYGEIEVDKARNKRLDMMSQHVPVITNLFGSEMPQMTEQAKMRLEKTYPHLAYDSDEIYKMYINELVQQEVNRNFNKIKDDVRLIVEKEFERTTPIAERYREEHDID